MGEKKDSSIFQFPSKFPVPPWTFRLDLSCHYQGSVFGVWTHFVLCFFLLLTTETTLLESWVCLTVLLIITNKSFATSFVHFCNANHGYCNLISLAHGNSQGFWNPPVVVFSVRKTRGLKIVVADDFGIYASAPSWMMLDVKCYARWWFHIFFNVNSYLGKMNPIWLVFFTCLRSP